MKSIQNRIIIDLKSYPGIYFKRLIVFVHIIHDPKRIVLITDSINEQICFKFQEGF